MHKLSTFAAPQVSTLQHVHVPAVRGDVNRETIIADALARSGAAPLIVFHRSADAPDDVVTLTSITNPAQRPVTFPSTSTNKGAPLPAEPRAELEDVVAATSPCRHSHRLIVSMADRDSGRRTHRGRAACAVRLSALWHHGLLRLERPPVMDGCAGTGVWPEPPINVRRCSIDPRGALVPGCLTSVLTWHHRGLGLRHHESAPSRLFRLRTNSSGCRSLVV
eukprot:7132340-Prymnesium_polylepis.1